MFELLDIVNENDEVIGQATRNEAHAKFLRHRFTRTLVFNDAGEMVLFQRAKHPKEIFAGTWDSAGGHISAGEDYLESAKRELQEEYGIEAELTKIGWMDCVIPNIENMHGPVYIAKHNGPYTGDAEVTNITPMPVEKVEEMFAENKDNFSPQMQLAMVAFKEFKEEK